MKQKYEGTLAERKKQALATWRANFKARDPEGFLARNRAIQKRDRERYGEARRQRERERYVNTKRCETLQSKYGITEIQFETLLDKQGGCAICSAKEAGGRYNRFHVDHDHATGAVRGLLCDACNRGIGLMRESADLLRSAARYLQSPPGIS